MCESQQQFQFSSLAENWDVRAKIIYKYQILYLDRITIVPWRHLVNNIDLCTARNRQKIHKTPYYGIQGYSRSLNSASIESQCVRLPSEG